MMYTNYCAKLKLMLLTVVAAMEVLINYDLIRADRSRSGGGVCLYVKNSINYLNRNDLVGDNLEAICIEVFKPSSASCIVGTIYRPQVPLLTPFQILNNWSS